MLLAIERFSVGLALLLALLAVGLTSGPKPRRWISDYVAAVFAPAAADADPFQPVGG